MDAFVIHLRWVFLICQFAIGSRISKLGMKVKQNSDKADNTIKRYFTK